MFHFIDLPFLTYTIIMLMENLIFKKLCFRVDGFKVQMGVQMDGSLVISYQSTHKKYRHEIIKEDLINHDQPELLLTPESMFEYIYANYGKHSDCCVNIDQHGKAKIKIKIQSKPTPKYFEHYFVAEEEKPTIIEEMEWKLEQVSN